MARSSLFDVFGRLFLDDTQFQAEAVRAGEKASDNIARTTSSRLRDGLGKAAKVGFAALSAGAALVTKDLVELDSVMADFTADTGATADEADRARKSIIKLSQDNHQGLAEIGKTMATLRTNMNLTGDEAEFTADKFLKFAHVTKRDAATEVAEFDDVLDAWGMTAKDIPRIMDLVIASHQKYGTSITGNVSALKTMAPQLKALNLTLDDGISLLNLFADSGIDAAAVPRALNSAIAKLDGKPLKDFLIELANIPDPLQRAQRASEVFGRRAGPLLANALKPGTNALVDYRLSAEDTTDALGDAEEALNSTFGARVQLMMKNFSGKLLEVADNVGPLATGLASAVSLGGALGLGRLAKALVGGMVNVGKEAGGALVEGLQVGIGAAGTIVGNFFASRIEALLDPTKPTLVGRALRTVAAKAAFVWGLTFAASQRFAEFLSVQFLRLPFLPQVRAAILASSLKVGTLAGTRTAIAFKVAFIAGVLFLWKEVIDTFFDQKAGIDAQARQIGASIAEQIKRGNLDELKASRAALLKGINDIYESALKNGILGGPQLLMSQEAINGMVEQIKLLDAQIAALGNGTATAGEGQQELADKTDEATQALRDELLAMGYTEDQIKDIIGTQAPLGDSLDAGTDSIKQQTNSWGVLRPAIGATASEWKKYREDTKVAQAQALTDQINFSSSALAALLSFQSDVESALAGVLTAEQEAQITQGRITILQKELRDMKTADLNDDKKITKAEKAEYEARRLAIENEMTTLKLHLALIGDDTHRVTALNALLTSQDMKDGLTSEYDNIRTAHENLRDKIIGYLRDIEDDGGDAAEDAAKIVKQWLDPNNPSSPLYGSKKWGSRTGESWLAGLNAALGDKADRLTFSQKLAWYKDRLAAYSPPGPKSPLHNIDKWGRRTGEAWTGPFVGALAAGAARAKDALASYRLGVGPLGGLGSMPSLAAAGVSPSVAAMQMAPAGPAGGGDTYNTTLVMPDAKNRDPFEVLERASRYQRFGVINPPKKES